MSCEKKKTVKGNSKFFGVNDGIMDCCQLRRRKLQLLQVHKNSGEQEFSSGQIPFMKSVRHPSGDAK